MSDRLNELLFNDDVAKHDPLFADLVRLEHERQARQITLIPSESICAWAVRRVLDSPFTNLYCEGYPPTGFSRKDEEQLGDVSFNLVHYRRYADRRFYKGNAYVNLVESTCRRRAAECFANERVGADQIYANVQPLSGAAANLAVYEAFLKIGDKLMTMDLMQGGHLSHGSQFHMSGKRYQIIPYGVDSRSEKLDYAEIRRIAVENKPKMIVAGFTSYPWAPDWAEFRSIADECGALLMADIAHPAGMVIAGAYPSPVGFADVITFTTHKTLMGPRGAVILTTTEDRARRIDTAVFPGEQGGPHMNNIAALAVAFELAKTAEFKELQHRIVANARLLADELQRLGLRVSYGGTDTHLLLIDLKPLATKTAPLYGEPVARILELAGIVANKNTIPGDEQTALATGIRMGTPWFTQRGAGPAEIKKLAELIHRVVTSIQPFTYQGVTRRLPRGKIEMEVLDAVSQEVAALTCSLPPQAGDLSGYPHYPFLDQTPDRPLLVHIRGERAQAFLQGVVTADLAQLTPGQVVDTLILDRWAKVAAEVNVVKLASDNPAVQRFVLRAGAERAEWVYKWLCGNADGYLLFEPEGRLLSKVEGPAVVERISAESPEAAALKRLPLPDKALSGRDARELYRAQPERFAMYKPFFVGQYALVELVAQPKERVEFEWNPPAEALRRTVLYDEHVRLGGKLVPFAGWEMPVRYQSTIDEHNAVRQNAGLFDVAHMGTFEISGPHAQDFLDLVTSNYVRWFGDNVSHYSYVFDPDGRLLDDVFVYRLHVERFLLVVNASNADKVWAWLNLVNDGKALIDRSHPLRSRMGRAVLRNLKDPQWGDDCKVDIALQGRGARAALARLMDGAERERMLLMRRRDVFETRVAGIDLVLSRTGYTGENMGFELFVNPRRAVELWRAILDLDLGVKPCGLGARDSLRTEAGLPLYGHELAGHYDISPDGAGFSGYVKLHKPFFVGKQSYLERERTRERTVVRFRVRQKGARPLKTGDPVIDLRGAFVGNVTSCAVDGRGTLVGLAYVNTRSAADEKLLAYPLPAGVKELPTPLNITKGQKMLIPVELTVMPRFPLKDVSKET